MIRVGDCNVYLDVLVRSMNHICFLSVYDSSLQRIKAFTAKVNINEGNILIEGDSIKNTDHYQTYITPVMNGKEKFYHAIMINQNLKTKIIISTAEQAGTDFFQFLMQQYDLPLLDWWGTELLARAERQKSVIGSTVTVNYGAYSFSREENKIFEDLVAYEIGLYDEEILQKDVKNLFAEGLIWISKHPQRSLDICNMDEYFKKYGHALVEALEKHITPLTELNGNCDCLTLMTKRMYPQQIAMVNGVLELLKTSSYAILNEGMGTGKTLQGASICEGYFVKKYMNSHPGVTLKDIYSERNLITYRNIVMAPGHLVEKWVQEISAEIPYCKAHILQEFRQLVQIRNNGPDRTMREFWVLSKDFAKLSYSSRPTPTKIRKKRPIRIKRCLACEKSFSTPDSICPYCGNDGYELGDVVNIGSGLVCPECGELLLEYKTMSNGEIQVLQPNDFANPTNTNSKCYYCGAMLWQPHVGNIDLVNLRKEEKHTPWYRASHYANKAHEGTKSVWVHKKYAREYFESIGEEPINERMDSFGVRKYSPAQYIKKYMKGYWDFAIFDEAHLYKGGATGQGNAMEALIKSSKKQLALTGTIAGGMAQHLFYLLFRLDPRRMIVKGYQWNDVMKFNRKYGTLETEYEVNFDYDESGVTYKQMTRGKMISDPHAKPGISPLVFTEFLLDKAVFLDLSDLSKYLPPLNEYVIPVELGEEERNMKSSYERVLNSIKKLLKEKGGRKLLGKMLQFSLSYLDRPFGPKRIIHPLDGSKVCDIDQYPQLCEGDKLLSKESKLLELIGKELGEGRKCCVYAEYTASPDTCVSYRLKQIIEDHLGAKVAVLESMSPEPLKREAWIHEQVEKNKVDVIITNPRCVETGLDFCWEANGTYYSIPTLIFFQMGYSLYTVWQASRRHFRLNQKFECRTYYMGLHQTIQMTAISIVAEKQVATSAIQGKFSSEGLAAMAVGVDMKLRLAQALADEDYATGNELQGMFDILGHEGEDDTTYDKYEPMLLLKEIIDPELLKELTTTVDTMIDMDELLDEIMGEMPVNVLEGRPEQVEFILESETADQKITIESLDNLYDLFV